MKIFVTSTLFVIAVVSIRIENEFGLGLPGSALIGPGPSVPKELPKNSCNDEAKHCSYWKIKGLCNGQFAGWMIKNCKKTCDKCSGWVKIKDIEILFRSDSVNMHRAVKICKQIGGRLFAPQAATEMAAAAHLASGAKSFWIGIQDKTSEGHFTYSNGRKISYTNWAKKQPNNHGKKGEDCVEAYGIRDRQPGKWNDVPCSTKLPFVCERSVTTKVNCQWSSWTKWSSCSRTCGNGATKRTRKIVKHAKNGGKKCVGSNMITKNCSIRKTCPSDVHIKKIGIYTWNAWYAHTSDHIYMTVRSNAGSCSIGSINGARYSLFHRGSTHFFSGYMLGRCRSSTIGRKWLSIDVATSGYDGWLMRWTKIYLSNGTVWSCYNTGRRWLDRPSCPKYSLICKC